jgi:hypothetical protein
MFKVKDKSKFHVKNPVILHVFLYSAKQKPSQVHNAD